MSNLLKTITLIVLAVTSSVTTAADEKISKSGFIRDWLLCGPFPNEMKTKGSREGFAFDFLAEHGGEGGIIPKKGQGCKIPESLTGRKDVNTEWSKYLSPSNIVSFKKQFPNSDNSVVYAYSEIDLSEEFYGAISVGSDDGIKVWLNGKLIHENKAMRGVMKDEDIIPAYFPKGKNRILAKIDNLQGGFGFCMRAATSPELLKTIDPEEESLQPESRFFSKRIKISNQRYRWLTKARKGPLKERSHAVKQGIMTQVGNRGSYAEYVQMDELFKMDFLEIRCFLSKMYDKEGNITRVSEIDKALRKAREAGVKQVQLSVILENGISDYYKERFTKEPVALMTNQTGKQSGSLAGDRHKKYNSQFFSYWDMQNRNYILSLVNDVVGYYESSEFKDLIFGWHFRFPTYNDWGYPRCDGFYDYSQPSVKAFQNYLKTEKGFDLSQLSKRYGIEYQDWSDVAIPKPDIKNINLNSIWLDYQEFRVWTLVENQEEICRKIRKSDDESEIVAWFTTALKSAGRDGIVIDSNMQLSKEFPKLMVSHTSVDFYNLPGELFGSLSRENNVPVNIEPVHCTMDSYLRTFYNCMRFPVKQINWLFWIDFSPATRPWITWVLDRGDILDELYDAESIVSPVANIYSYSDLHCKIPATLEEAIPSHDSKQNWFRALNASGYDLPWLSDFSTNLSWDNKKTIICGENQILRPEAIEKIISFCKQGGKLIILGETGSYNMQTMRKDWPLLTQLGVDKETIIEQKTDETAWSIGTFLPGGTNWLSDGGIGLKKLPDNLNAKIIASTERGLIKAALWKLEKGEVLFWGDKYESLLKNTETSLPELNSIGRKLIHWGEAFRPVIASNTGICTFLKKKGDAFYAGLINANDDVIDGNIKIMNVDPNKNYSVNELLFNEMPETIITGKDLASKGIDVSFGFNWEVKLLKITEQK